MMMMMMMMQTEVNTETGEPHDNLTPVAVDWCRSIGSNADKVSDIIDKNDVKVCRCVCDSR